MANTERTASSNATIQQTDRDTFAVVVDGKVLRADFPNRAMAAMWAARKKLYKGTTPRRRKQEIPPELVDESIKLIPLLAKLSGKSYREFLTEAKSGLYGELYRLGKRSLGLKYGNYKRAMAARIIK